MRGGKKKFLFDRSKSNQMGAKQTNWEEVGSHLLEPLQPRSRASSVVEGLVSNSGPNRLRSHSDSVSGQDMLVDGISKEEMKHIKEMEETIRRASEDRSQNKFSKFKVLMGRRSSMPPLDNRAEERNKERRASDGILPQSMFPKESSDISSVLHAILVAQALANDSETIKDAVSIVLKEASQKIAELQNKDIAGKRKAIGKKVKPDPSSPLETLLHIIKANATDQIEKGDKDCSRTVKEAVQGLVDAIQTEASNLLRRSILQKKKPAEQRSSNMDRFLSQNRLGAPRSENSAEEKDEWRQPARLPFNLNSFQSMHEKIGEELKEIMEQTRKSIAREKPISIPQTPSAVLVAEKLEIERQ
ncbi:MAG: hypothetical protein K0R25_777 [Rickettsiaceae bacterium]|jgi:hypothetical protein|nr:hypothetical protein [Rickettsiaceae bacterium]